MGMRSGLGTGSTVGQVFLVIVNIVFAVLGIGLIVLGAYLKLNKAVDARILGLLKMVDLGGLALGDLLLVLAAFIIVVGVFTLLVSASGGFGACLRKKGLLILYVIILALIVVIELALFILWCKLAYGTDNWLKEKFNNLFRFYNGTFNATDLYSRGWNLMFMLLDCCGSSPITAFQNDFQQLNTYWWRNLPQRGLSRIPYTCCKDSNINNYMMGTNPACQLQLQFYRRRGCYDAFRKLLKDLSASAITLSVVLLVAETLAIIAAILLIVQINREKRQTLDPANYKKGRHEIPLPDPKVH